MAGMLVALCGACPAAAATRVADPLGTGTACTDAAPCGIVTAINSATDDDEVILNPGEYGTVASPLTTMLVSSGANVTIHGRDGSTRPRIVSSSVGGLNFSGAGSVVRDLAFRSVYSGNGQALLVSGSALVERVEVRAEGLNSIACAFLGTTTLRDAVCVNTGDSSTALDVNGTLGGPNDVTARNVTAIVTGAPGAALFGDAVRVFSTSTHSSALSATNVIAQGSNHDVEVLKDTQAASVKLDHVDADDVHLDGGATTTDLGGNMTAPPAFADAAAFNFHELPTSPTVDAGRDDPLNGTLAFDGTLRTLGTRTDIGAAELIPPPIVTTGAPSDIGQTTATVSGSAVPNGGSTTGHFEFGVTTAYGQQGSDVPLGAGLAPQTMQTVLTGLEPGTTYHYRLVASNSSATATGADATFTTQAVPPPPALQPPVLSGVKQSHRTWRVDRRHRTAATARTAAPKGTTFSYALSADATVTFVIQRARPHGKFKTAMRLRRAARAGTSRTRFTGRVGSKLLKRGRYRVVIRAANAAGTSAARTLRFRIVTRA